MTCSFVLLHSFSTSFNSSSTLLFLLLLLTTIHSTNHVWAKDEKEECQIDEVVIKGRNGEIRPIFTGESGTTITFKVKGFKRKFTVRRPGKQIWTGKGQVIVEEKAFFWVVCQYQNGSSSGNYKWDHFNISSFRKKTTQSQVQHLWKTCAPNDKVREDSGYLLCPLRVEDELCLFWATAKKNIDQLKQYTNDDTLRSCIQLNTSGRSCVFEKKAEEFVDKYCREDGSMFVPETCENPRRKLKNETHYFAVFKSQHLTCSDFKPLWERFKYKIPAGNSTFTIPSCTPNLRADFRGSCDFLYEHENAMVKIKIKGRCDKGWKLEISDEMKKGNAWRIICSFSRRHPIHPESADVNFMIEFERGHDTSTDVSRSTIVSTGETTTEPRPKCGTILASWVGIVMLTGVGAAVVLIVAVSLLVAYYIRLLRRRVEVEFIFQETDQED